MTAETKSPGRPKNSRFLTLGKLTIGALLLIPAAFVGFRAYEVFSTPDIGEPFDVEAFASYTLPNVQNAFVHYRNAIKLFFPPKKVLESDPAADPQKFWDSQSAAGDGWEHAIPAVRRWVALNRGTLDEMKRGSELAEGLERPLSEALDAGMNFDSWAQLRECARLEAAEGARLIAEGQTAEAWVCYRSLLRLSRHLAMHSQMLSSLVGGAIADLGVRGGVRWSAQKSVGAADLKKAIRDVLSVEEMKTPASDTIKVEYLGLHAFANRGVLWGATVPPWVQFTGYPAQVARTARLVVANLLTQADRPLYLRTPIHPGPLKLFELDPTSAPDPKVRPPDEIERSAISSAGAVAKSLNWISPEVASNIEIQDPKMLLENLNGACQATDTAQTRRDVLLLALALQLHYREHRKFPASLDELVKQGYLKSIPADPFGKGEPFRYRREPDPKQSAVVWSVWVDGIDQGGVDLHFGGNDWGFRVAVPETNDVSDK
jgi:hypothetical protein